MSLRKNLRQTSRPLFDGRGPSRWCSLWRALRWHEWRPCLRYYRNEHALCMSRILVHWCIWTFSSTTLTWAQDSKQLRDSKKIWSSRWASIPLDHKYHHFWSQSIWTLHNRYPWRAKSKRGCSWICSRCPLPCHPHHHRLSKWFLFYGGEWTRGSL